MLPAQGKQLDPSTCTDLMRRILDPASFAEWLGTFTVYLETHRGEK